MSTQPASRARPPITLSTTLVPSQYLTLATIHLRAFGSTRVRQLMVPPSGLDAPSFEDMVAANVHNRLKYSMLCDPSLTTLLALSPTSNTILGFAQWLAPVDRTATLGNPTPEEIEREEKAAREYARFREAAGEEGDAWREGEKVVKETRRGYDFGFMAEYGAKLDKGLKEWARGRGHWTLQVIAVDPDHQGQGVGSALLDWGVERAMQDGLPVWLDALSLEGMALYKSRGFRAVCWHEMADKDGPSGMLRWPGMALGEFINDDA